MQKIHLDTDIGGDIDDLCALAMLLKWPGLEITGVICSVVSFIREIASESGMALRQFPNRLDQL